MITLIIYFALNEWQVRNDTLHKMALDGPLRADMSSKLSFLEKILLKLSSSLSLLLSWTASTSSLRSSSSSPSLSIGSPFDNNTACETTDTNIVEYILVCTYLFRKLVTLLFLLETVYIDYLRG